jgi:hypothetical protein
LAEQLFCKQQVTGSIPVAGSMEDVKHQPKVDTGSMEDEIAG